MKKVIRLTESSVVQLIRRVIKEEEMFAKATINYPTKGSTTKYLDSRDTEVQGDIDFSENREFGPEDYDSFMEYINKCDTKWCIKTKVIYDMYTKMGNITVGKGTRR